MKREYLSIEHEPALHSPRGEIDPSEERAAPTDAPASDWERLRDSVAVEPALPDRHDPNEWTTWLAAKSRACRPATNALVIVAAGLLGGLFGVVGVFFTDHPGRGLPMISLVLGAPVVEELLKQSGGIFLLERMSYRIRRAWQLMLVGGLAGLVFSIVENGLYALRFHLAGDPRIVEHMAWRWALCTPLHVVCSLIAVGGLVRAWKLSLRAGRWPHLSDAFGYWVVAMLLHGAYNFAAALCGPQ